MVKFVESKALAVARRILAVLGVEHPEPVGGIPFLRDGRIHWVWNTHGLAPGVENCADPVKVERLRRAAHRIAGNEPTYAYFAQIGYSSAKIILERPIKTRRDVIGWADSIFNWGPGTGNTTISLVLPKTAMDAILLSSDDFRPLVTLDDDYYVVLPVSPLYSGDEHVKLIYDGNSGVERRSSGTILGPRNEISKLAFVGSQIKKENEVPTATITKIGARKSGAKKAAPTATAVRKPAKAVAEKTTIKAPVTRRVGRPRLDGLAIGSREVEMLKSAYAAKRPVAESVINKMNEDGQARARLYNEKILAAKSNGKVAAKNGRVTKAAAPVKTVAKTTKAVVKKPVASKNGTAPKKRVFVGK